MKLIKSQIENIKFYHREGTSDLKTFEEVITRNVYQQRGNKITKGETWYDFGGNVGAFTLLACSKGADVVVYEPDPYNCEMIEKNLKLNNFKAEIRNKAVIDGDKKEMILFIGNNNQVWRNSLYKNWNGKGIKIKCEKFDEVIPNDVCVKMDIEGAEMPIIENTNKVFQKFIFEWSFDIDDSLIRFWNVIDLLKEKYDVKFSESSTKYKTRDYITWQKSWFPACTNVFCYKK
jgi:FkbM family methyltransferase